MKKIQMEFVQETISFATFIESFKEKAKTMDVRQKQLDLSESTKLKKFKKNKNCNYYSSKRQRHKE